jgi:hypothetical protein
VVVVVLVFVVVVLVRVVVLDVVVVVVAEPPPVAEPFTVNDAGTGLAPENVPWRPNVVDAPGASAPLYATFVAVTARPDCVTFAFQALVTCCPASGNVQPSVQADTASPVFRTFTSATKPPAQDEVTV